MQGGAAFAAPPAQFRPHRGAWARRATSVASPLAVASAGGPGQHGKQQDQRQQQQSQQQQSQQQRWQQSRTRAARPQAPAADPAAAAAALATVAAPSARPAAATKVGPAPAWELLRCEARTAAAEEPLLASFMFATVLNHRSLQSALAFHLANKLASPAIPATQLMRLFADVFAGEVQLAGGAKDERLEGTGRDAHLAAKMDHHLRLDLLAVMERDPACTRFIDCLCYFKGFHALQAYRVSHELWLSGKVALAYHLQSQVSKELQVDIHPAAVIGPGAFFDHATGVVIGETCTIGKNVSMLHQVTLGGSGSKHGIRHPQIGDGVLIGAGATLLGNISIGNFAQIGAGSLVLEDVPENSTVVGVPARIVSRTDASGVAGKVVPALDMKHDRCLGEEAHCCVDHNGLMDQNGTAHSNGIGPNGGMSVPKAP
jgi:serine O-acetyltransferase